MFDFIASSCSMICVCCYFELFLSYRVDSAWAIIWESEVSSELNLSLVEDYKVERMALKSSICEELASSRLQIGIDWEIGSVCTS